jgi:4-amino-4-deoxy-L-arabinose transferase-like glycosyltransferase
MPTTATSYQRKMGWLIGVTVVIKIILSHFLELGNDEVYYYTYAVQPDWNHFDHPGMVGWMMRLTSLNLHWVSTLSMRLGSIICAGLATMVIFKTGTLIKDEKAGYIAAWMYTLSIYTSIIAGLFVLPDSPQLLFFTLSIYWMIKWVIQPSSFTTKHWLLLGVLIGLATLSKVHGLYLWVGFGAFILFHQIKTLQNARVYLAILITLLCILPIVYWNFQNDFITYRYHSQRVMHTGLLLDSFLQQIVGELIYQNPLVYLAAIIALLNVKKIKVQLLGSSQNEIITQNDSEEAKSRAQTINLLLWLSLPLIFTFWTLSLFNPTLPHWTGPGFIGLFIIAGVYWSQRLENKQESSNKSMPLVLNGALGLLGASILGFLMFVYTFPRQMGSVKIENLGEYNPINDVTGWESFSESFAKIAAQDIKLGLMQETDPIITHKWFPAGHILFYTAKPLNKRVIAIGSLEDIHKFAWLNKTQNALKIGENAYCIVPSNLPADPNKLYGNYFETISKPDTIPMISKGVLLRNFYVYRLMHCKQVPLEIIKN